MSAPSGVAAGTPAASLPDLIARGEWRRARATARVLNAPPDLQEVLDATVDLQDELRARRYPGARRALADLTRALPQTDGPEGEALRAALDPGALAAALAALDAGHRQTGQRAGEQTTTGPDDLADDLAARLAGALAQPLTRAEALNQQGVLLAVAGEAERAREVLNAALEADPGHYRALTNLGNLDMEAGHYAQAEAVYRRVLALNPDYDGGHHNLGVALRRQGRVAEGVRSIRQGQRLGLKRSKTETDAEMKEQFARHPALKSLRWVLVAAVILILFLAVRGAGG